MYLIFLLFAANPFRTIALDTNGEFLVGTNHERVGIFNDGSFGAAANYSVWHWDAKGNLINHMGRKGQGPGEFGYITDFHFDGNIYWIADGSVQRISFFDKNGNYINSIEMRARQFISTKDTVYALSPEISGNWNDSWPALFQAVTLATTDQGFTLKPKGPHIVKASQKLKDFYFNWKLHWFVQRGEDLLVVNQIENIVRVYTPTILAQETKMSNDQPFPVSGFTIAAKGYLEAPEVVTLYRDNNKFKTWLAGWSRITYFGTYRNGYLLGWETPDPEDKTESILAFQALNEKAHGTSEKVEIHGFLMGSKDSEIYVLRETDDPDEIEDIYALHVYKL